MTRCAPKSLVSPKNKICVVSKASKFLVIPQTILAGLGLERLIGEREKERGREREQ